MGGVLFFCKMEEKKITERGVWWGKENPVDITAGVFSCRSILGKNILYVAAEDQMKKLSFLKFLCPYTSLE